MKVAPIDIAHKTFDRKLNGLDSQEVYDFLKDVADQMEEVIRERNQLKDQMRERELQIMEYRERDETLKATITTATRMTEQMRVEAEKESNLILQDARQRAEIISREARDNLKRTYQEINELKKLRMQFEANLRSVIQAHVSILEQGRIFMKEPNLPQGDFQSDEGAHHSQAHYSQNQQPQAQQPHYTPNSRIPDKSF